MRGFEKHEVFTYTQVKSIKKETLPNGLKWKKMRCITVYSSFNLKRSLDLNAQDFKLMFACSHCLPAHHSAVLTVVSLLIYISSLLSILM